MINKTFGMGIGDFIYNELDRKKTVDSGQLHTEKDLSVSTAKIESMKNDMENSVEQSEERITLIWKKLENLAQELE